MDGSVRQLEADSGLFALINAFSPTVTNIYSTDTDVKTFGITRRYDLENMYLILDSREKISFTKMKESLLKEVTRRCARSFSEREN